jgi:hypothetical protein
MSVMQSDPALIKEDMTKNVIPDTEIVRPPKEVVEAPVFLPGRDENSPLQDQTEKSAGWISFRTFKYTKIGAIILAVALLALIPA